MSEIRHVVLVTGGRDYTDKARVWAELDAIHAKRPITRLVDGGCPTGVDKFARLWAIDRRVPKQTYRAKWHLYGGAAGPIRNGVMVKTEKPETALAMPGNNGTHDCVTRCLKAGVEIIDPDNWWADLLSSPSVSTTTGKRNDE